MESNFLEGRSLFLFGGDVVVCWCTVLPKSLSIKPMGEYAGQPGFYRGRATAQGHGYEWKTCLTITYHDWIASAGRAAGREIRKHCRTIFVAGLSMGATLALHLACSHPIPWGVIPICGPVFMKDFRLIFLPPFHLLVKTVPRIGSDIRGSHGYGALSYDRVPLAALGELLKLCPW